MDLDKPCLRYPHELGAHPRATAQYQNPADIRRILADTRRSRWSASRKIRNAPATLSPRISNMKATRSSPSTRRPMRSSVSAATPNLLCIEEQIDLVDIFRPPAACDEIIEQAIAKAGQGDLDAVAHRQSRRGQARPSRWPGCDRRTGCVKMEHGRYNGSLHWVGMNTEIVTAKKARRFF